MIDYLEIYFWKIAIRIIRKGYGNACDDYDENCACCQANKTINWIEEHIKLIRM